MTVIPVVSAIFVVPVESYRLISIAKYFRSSSDPYDASNAFSTASFASSLSEILITKLSLEPDTVAETSPLLEMPDFVTSTLVLPAVVAGFLLTVLLLTLPFLLATAAAPFLAVAVGFGEAVAAPVLLPLLPPPLLFVLPLFVFPLVVSEEISPVQLSPVDAVTFL